MHNCKKSGRSEGPCQHNGPRWHNLGPGPHFRLLFDVETLMSALLSTHPHSSGVLGAGALNVGFSLSISVSLGIWAYDFLHRFDSEDPSVPPDIRRRSQR
jgi:hypothetical protein